MSAAFDALASKAPLEPLFTSFDWKSLGKGTVVDVGGSYGAVAIGLAKRFPELSVIVQDFPETVKQGAAQLPVELKDRVSFLPDSFLNEQTVKDADAYYFRAIFHNWPDAYCIKILRNQIPALKSGARIIINDLYEPEPNTRPPMLEKHLRLANRPKYKLLLTLALVPQTWTCLPCMARENEASMLGPTF